MADGISRVTQSAKDLMLSLASSRTGCASPCVTCRVATRPGLSGLSSVSRMLWTATRPRSGTL